MSRQIPIRFDLYGNQEFQGASITSVTPSAHLPTSAQTPMGTLVVDDVIVSARLPADEMLTVEERKTMAHLMEEACRLRPFGPRGQNKAGWCKTFVGNALTVQNDGKLAMPYTCNHLNPTDQHCYVQFYKKLR